MMMMMRSMQLQHKVAQSQQTTYKPLGVVTRPFSLPSLLYPNININRVLVQSSKSNFPEPADARGAISIGLKLTEEGSWESALGFFEQALTLPGTGLKRFRDKPNLISNGEKMAALYNIACCQSRLAAAEEDAEKRSAHIQNGLVALAGCLECGYDDFNQIRNDDDLAVLRTSEKFEGLVQRFDRRGPSLSSFLPWN